MKAVTKIVFLDDQGEKFFGEGPFQLLRAVEATGSLRAAAMSMGMAYTKALKVLKNAENALGFSLTVRTTGGKDGGGSQLTPEGKEWLLRYDNYRNACVQANHKLYQEFFSDKTAVKTGCVIMASGLGKRFGGNKLMADFHGKRLIEYVLDATEGLFTKRVAVTRHADVAELCRERNVDVVLHDLPHRSDTVRLGMEALGTVDSCMFCPADQPLLRRETVEALLHCAAEQKDRIWRTCRGQLPGSPVIFPAWAFDELKSLPEGKGGSFLLEKYPELVSLMEVSDVHELMDADTPEALELLKDYYMQVRHD